jgi:hypothetical protein
MLDTGPETDRGAATRRYWGTWLFGRDDYAHPALRWVATPPFRVALVLGLVTVFLDPGTRLRVGIAAIALTILSFAADLLNAAVLRRRRRETPPAPPLA